MLFLITHMQSPQTFAHIGRLAETYSESTGFKVDVAVIQEILSGRGVELHAFALMTNHVHIALCEKLEGGISTYMQRVLTAYAKYFNTKYSTVGHVFQTPYRAIHVVDNNQLLYLSTYIHRNPRELPGVAGTEHVYPWSSYRDYVTKNRFGELLKTSIVLDQFKSELEYHDFVDSSVAKELIDQMEAY